MTPLLEQLMDLCLRDPDAFRKLLDRNSQKITPLLAQEAHEVFLEAFRNQQAGSAAAAAITASNLYLRLGNRYEGLKHYLYFQQVRYMAASTEEEYQDVRDEGRRQIDHAVEISAFDLAFEAATLAANCAYFTADLQSIPAAKEQWLRQTLGDLTLASGYGLQAKRDGIEQFASLLTGFMEIFTTLVPSPDATEELQLRQLAQAVEKFVPPDFQFQVAGGSEKTANSARWLAVLSHRFGNSEIAKRRLEFAGRNRP